MPYHEPVNTLRFHCAPPASVLSFLKDHGFRWNRRGKCWTARQSIYSAFLCDTFQGWDPAAELTEEHRSDIELQLSEIAAEDRCGMWG